MLLIAGCLSQYDLNYDDSTDPSGFYPETISLAPSIVRSTVKSTTENLEDVNKVNCNVTDDSGVKVCTITNVIIDSPDFIIVEPPNAQNITKLVMRSERGVIEFITWGKKIINFIPRNIGTLFRNLEIMFLYENKIKTISKPEMSQLYNLKTLSLIDNKIETIAENAFEDLRNLIILDLDDNEISIILPNTFKSLINVEKIKIDNNKLTTLDEKTFANNKKLLEIHLKNNKIAILSPNMLDGLHNLKAIDLRNNRCLDENYNRGNITTKYTTGVSQKCKKNTS